MTFIHDSEDFTALVEIAAENRGLAFPSMAEKDYWITHTLWALGQCDLELWFKGGTSLAKAWGLVDRFSEDIDLRLEAKAPAVLPEVSSWSNDSKRAVETRRAHFEAMTSLIKVPGAQVRLGPSQDERWRSADILVEYKAHFPTSEPLVPYVRIEAGNARVTPFVARDISSFLHAELASRGESQHHTDNIARGVRVVHPLVTLIEKLDAIAKRYGREDFQAQTFVRHYEDAAKIVDALESLPQLKIGTTELIDEMLRLKQIKAKPSAQEPSLLIPDKDKKQLLLQAHSAIGGMFWGERLTIDQACTTLRRWVTSLTE